MKYFRCNIFGKLASNEADFKQNYYNNGLKYKIYNNGLKYKICIAKLFQQFMGFSGFDHFIGKGFLIFVSLFGFSDLYMLWVLDGCGKYFIYVSGFYQMYDLLVLVKCMI